MKNIVMVAEGGILTIKVDLTKDYGPSSTGKTHIVATTRGPKPIAGYPEISVGLNVFRKKPKRKAPTLVNQPDVEL